MDVMPGNAGKSPKKHACWKIVACPIIQPVPHSAIAVMICIYQLGKYNFDIYFADPAYIFSHLLSDNVSNTNYNANAHKR